LPGQLKLKMLDYESNSVMDESSKLVNQVQQVTSDSPVVHN
ncbi:12976_t:CDS:1, partial [Racocetra fulgida]